ncbi:signal transduction histidine kinase/ActR/RegA family two-component response regulator [Duganella sp. SG902]|uniref:ATP-binding protein n=1 Tax=Duganella sp. SG902 TaxID=2587016 RepID=UPI00159D534B|nr:ATP-binding protein [Duganella sp. SG902]NVM75741.1 signal transduction histidine kinase/ActR/RegA family two-component response regulator [Duganella sp. SG902]
MNQTLSRPVKISSYLVTLLLVATPTLLIWHHFGMTRTLEISARQPHGVRLADDRKELNGDSVSTLTRTDDALTMHCQPGATQVVYRFCKMQFLVGDPIRGVDFSQFETITFDLRYRGEPQVIKLHLMNFEPELSVAGDWNSQRFNEAEIKLPPQPVFTIPLNVLHTAEWWRSSYKVPLSQSYTRLDHVTAIELSTVTLTPGQPVALELRSIKFRGKWISKTNLLMGLVSAWIGCGLLGLSLGLLHLRFSLSASNSRLDSLTAIDRERKAAEAAREAALAEALRLARQRSNFIAQMSHELRTPLNAIMGYAQLLRRDGHQLTEQQATSLATIHESGQHLLTLINDILDLARVEAGKMALYPAATALAAFLKGVADIVRVKAEEKGLVFHYELAAGLPDTVIIDQTRLRQVLLNLLGNAVKFTDRGTVSLRILPAPAAPAVVDGQPAAGLRFEVTDSGIGMSAQQLGRVFQPFEQMGNMERREGGAGLGLAISQQLVRLMGGAIAVVSEPGKGSTFWFDLLAPLAAGSPAGARPPHAMGAYEGERKRLLIVDDVPQNRAMLVALLQATGFVVAAAENGLECLVLLDSFQPELIVMDVMMPLLDGNETTRRIRAMPAWRRTPIITVTASASPEDASRSYAAGADAFLVKPIDHDALLHTIGTLLSLSWIAGADAAESAIPADDAGAPLAVPPAPQIEALWQLAQLGNMREIRKWADHLQTLDPAYAPFAARLHTLARGYQSLALSAFVARYREDAAPGD